MKPLSHHFSSKDWLGQELRFRWKSLVLATMCSFGAGAVSSLLVSFVGPGLKLLMQPEERDLELPALVGERLSWLFGQFSVPSSFSSQDFLSVLPVLLLACAFFRTFFLFTSSFTFEKTGEKIVRQMRQRLLDQFLSLPCELHVKPQYQEKEAQLSSLITSDLRLVKEYIVHFYGGLPREISISFMMIVTLILLSPKLFLVFFFGLLPALFFVRYLGKKLLGRSRAALMDYSLLSEWLQQRLLGIEVIKQAHTEELEVNKLETLNFNLYRKFLKESQTKARTSPLIQGISIVAMTLVILLALWDISAGSLQGSVAVSFMASLGILSQSLSLCGRYYNANRNGMAALQRLQEIITYIHDHQNQPSLLSKGEAILEVEHLSFAYACEKEIISDFSYCFKEAGVYAVTGPSGSGKSTFMKLAMGLLKPAQGQVKMRDAESFGYMPQDFSLASDTLEANICYPLSVVDAGRLERAVDKAQLTQVIQELPCGVASMVGAGYHQLSGGQIQRVLLARLFYHKFPLVFVDEGTSALDPECESLILRGLRELAKEALVIMIAHRPKAIEMADEVIAFH